MARSLAVAVLVVVAGAREAGATPPLAPGVTRSSPPDLRPEATRHWVWIGVRQDLPWIEGTGPCSPPQQATGEFSCFRADEAQYLGTPDDEANVEGGLGVGTTRVLLGYERFVHRQVTVGAVLGVVVRGGAPRALGAEATAFLPLHAEVGGTLWPLGAPARAGGVAPFAGVGAGVQQIDGHFTLHVREREGAPPARSQLDNPAEQKLDVYRKLGTGFAAGSAGIAAVPVEGLVVRLAASYALLFPATGSSVGLESSIAIEL